VGEGGVGMETHAEGLGGREIQFRLNRAEIFFERGGDSGGELGRGTAVIPQREVAGLALAVVAFDLLVALGLFERALDLGIRPEPERALPLLDRPVEAGQTVVGPASALCPLRRSGGAAAPAARINAGP